MQDGVYVWSGVTLRVSGYNRTVAALRRAGADARDISDIMGTVSSFVAGVARPLAPYRTGTLERTIRGSRAQRRATVRAGTKSVPYAGPIHYGWPKRNIKPQPFLLNALDQSHAKVVDYVDKGITRLCARHGLPTERGIL